MIDASSVLGEIWRFPSLDTSSSKSFVDENFLFLPWSGAFLTPVVLEEDSCCSTNILSGNDNRIDEVGFRRSISAIKKVFFCWVGFLILISFSLCRIEFFSSFTVEGPSSTFFMNKSCVVFLSDWSNTLGGSNFSCGWNKSLYSFCHFFLEGVLILAKIFFLILRWFTKLNLGVFGFWVFLWRVLLDEFRMKLFVSLKPFFFPLRIIPTNEM